MQLINQRERELAAVHRILAFALLLPFLMWGVKVSAQSISCGTVATLTVQGLIGVDTTPRQGIVYLGQAQATGGTSCGANPYLWSLLIGSLPPGLGPLNAVTGNIPGTPTTAGSYTFTVQAKDCGIGTQQQTATKSITMVVATISSIAVTPAFPSIAQQTQQQFVATATWSDSRPMVITTVAAWTSSAPSIATIGASTGLATALTTNGSTTIQASFNSINGSTTLTVTGGAQPQLVIQQTTVPDGQHLVSYVPFTFTATCMGCTGPYTWSAVGTPPTGMTLNSSTTLSTTYTGTPTGTTATFTVKVQDSAAHSATQSITHTIATVVSVAVTPTPVSIAQGSHQQFTCTATYTSGSPLTQPCQPGAGGISAPNVWNNLNDTSTTENSRSLTVSGVSGQTAIACGWEGLNGNDNFTFTSTPAATWPTPTYVASGTGRRAGCSVLTNAPALTQVVVSFFASGGGAENVNFDGIHVVLVSGAATSNSLDGSIVTNSLAPGGTVASDQSSSLTTTNAADLLIYFTRWGNDQTGWTPASDFTIPNNSTVGAGNFGTNARAALSYKLVSAIQTAVTTTMTGNAGTGTYMDLFMGIKSAVTTGVAWDTTSCTNGAGNTVASVDANGQGRGLQAGTCNIRATFDGQNNTAALTVTAQSLQSLAVAPSPANVAVGAMQSFTAIGNDGNHYENNPSTGWASGNQNVATMNGRTATCIAAGTNVTISATVGTIVGTATLNCVAVTGNALLTGVAPPNDNCTGFTVPAGWTCVTTQTFESGAVHANEYIVTGGSITGTFAHTGTKSLFNRITFDAAATQWGLFQNNLGGSRHVYVSFYRYMDGNACGGVEIYFARFFKNNGDGINNFMDTDNYTGTTCSDNLTTAFYSSSNNAAAPNFDHNGGGYNLSSAKGQWEQIEVEFQGNVGSSTDGIMKLWVNGVQKFSETGTNVNGSLDATNMAMELGPLFTYIALDGTTRIAPPNGSFNSYIDDIIVLKQ